MYSFTLHTKINNSPCTIEVIYPNHNTSEELLARELRLHIEEYNRRIAPTRMLFVCPSGLEILIESCFSSLDSRYQDRIGSIEYILIAPFNYQGSLIKSDVKEPIRRTDDEWQICDDILVQYALQHLNDLFSRTKALQVAPHGYVFSKLSGREENYFIRAANILREHGCLAIFCHLLLRKLPINCTILYIDSSTILSFALALQSVIGHFKAIGTPISMFEIECTRSYEVSADFRVPNEDNYAILISATTSGGLAQSFVNDHNADIERIIHLISVGKPTSNYKESSVLFKELSQVRSQNSIPAISSNSLNKSIRIASEEFLVEQSAPRPVRISMSHVNSDASKKLQLSFFQHALKFGRSTHSNQPYSQFSVSNQAIDNSDSPISSWIRNQLIHEIPASISTIVHFEDEMSQRVAEWITQNLGAKNLSLLPVSEIQSSLTNTDVEDSSIVVVSHHDPRLELLQRANIELRNFRGARRHYVVCYSFLSSRVEHERLRADLRISAENTKHGWSEFVVLPVGELQIHDALASYNGVYATKELQKNKNRMHSSLFAALLLFRNRNAINGETLFLPKTTGEPLKLRHESVFFPNCEDEISSQIVVYAMVSAAIQDARDPQRTGMMRNTELVFDENPFVRTVLDPVMFNRYSDGILQASLLRATRPLELDYSANSELSGQFTSTCKSILLSHETSSGEAALEFLYALSTEKISLTSDHKEQILQIVQSIPILDACWNLFLTSNDSDAEYIPLD